MHSLGDPLQIIELVSDHTHRSWTCGQHQAFQAWQGGYSMHVHDARVMYMYSMNT
jgi:hypothetical protein